jgi:hypothetical protein
LEVDDFGRIVRFYFAQTEEVTLREGAIVTDELLNDLKRFAAGGLPRDELERISIKIASNAMAIETLAREIKLRRNRQHAPS